MANRAFATRGFATKSFATKSFATKDLATRALAAQARAIATMATARTSAKLTAGLGSGTAVAPSIGAHSILARPRQTAMPSPGNKGFGY